MQAVLLDLDGTLIDSLGDIADSMNAVLAALGLPVHPANAYRRFIGDGVEWLVRRALPESRRSTGEVREVTARVVEEYSRRWKATTRPYPGIPELLDELTSRGIRLAILSNKPHAATLAAVEEFLAPWRFDAVQGAGAAFPRKPDPAGALAIARSLGLPPKAFAYLGDTDTDMRTAIAAGMFPFGVLWGFRDAENLRSAGANVLLSHPLDLLPLLD